MRAGYGVRWRDAAGEVNGRLTVGSQSLRLMALDGQRVPLREVAFDAIRGFEVTGAYDRPTLVFHSSTEGQIEIESSIGRWILGDLLKEMLRAMLVQAPARHRFLVSVKTKPECREHVAELLEDGPPFDLLATSITRHDVFLLDDQVLFVFETDARIAGDDLLDDVWRYAESWHEVVLEVREAEQLFSWTRPIDLGQVVSGVGLGY